MAALVTENRLADPDSASLHVGLKLRDGLHRPAGTDVIEIHRRHHAETVCVAAVLDDLQQVLKALA